MAGCLGASRRSTRSARLAKALATVPGRMAGTAGHTRGQEKGCPRIKNADMNLSDPSVAAELCPALAVTADLDGST